MRCGSFERVLVSRLLKRVGNMPVRVHLWDGAPAYEPSGPALGSITFHDRGSLWLTALDPELHFGDAYSEGRISVEGDLRDILTGVYRSMEGVMRRSWYAAALSRWLSFTQRNSLSGSRRNIHSHYDKTAEFYSLWLDPDLLYTCAYFPDPGISLTEAQIAKMDHVCRKVRLQPGETVVEAGCGWGALALHMARRYGARVRAFNISHEQIQYARERAKLENMEDRVEFIEDDYRNIRGTYDVFMSVGMLEHLGTEHYRGLGSVVDRCLSAHGRGFLHFIGRNRALPLNAWIRKRIFPGAYPPTLREMSGIFEDWNFSVLDLENLRLHYALTLDHWFERFEQSAGTVARMFDSRFVRAWRLYLAGSAAAFRTGWLQLFQVVFARGNNNRLPWTRAHVYRHDVQDQESQWISATS